MIRTVDDDLEDVSDTSHKSNPDSVRQARVEKADSLRDARQHITDSTKAARTHIIDSTREAHQHITDSTNTARKQRTDSIQAVRKHALDSTAAINKYRNSKHYKDSVTHARAQKTKALTKSRQMKMDSLKDVRKQITDSLTAIRKARTDSIRTVQKRRSDSLAVIQKYKTSKRYADSVSIVRHNRMDSIKTVQKHFRDSLATWRKHTLDSAKVARKHITDSTKLVRDKYIDSIKLVRKARADSLAKVKAQKELLAKAKEKKKLDSMKLKLEIKMKQKHEAWSNKSMLKKKWSPVRRGLQNSFTHYNYYFNANKKMGEALDNMQRTRKENYDSLIGLYPFDPNRDSSMIARDMDSIIHKISIGIQIHDPRVKWSNDLYLLLGEAYYYKGGFNNAAIAFRYIISKDEEEKKKQAVKNGYSSNNKSKDAPSILEEENKSKLDFLKHKSVHNEAVLWLARTYTESHNVENTQSVLSLLESDSKLPENLKGRLAVERAFADLAEKNNVAASEQLSIAMEDNNLPNWLRLRAAFLNGQLQQDMENYTEAANSFEKVLTYFPKLEMDFYSRKYIAYNRLLAGENIEDAITPLKKILNDGKYVNYYDQVYFVLGQLAAKASKSSDAIKYLTKSTTTPKATKKQKALSFAALGDVYYSAAQYPSAQNAYDSAIKYSSAAPKDEAIVRATQRSKGLKEVSGPAAVIHEQDSLLALAQLSHKEQIAAVREYLRYLEQKQQDSIENAENSATVAIPTDQDNDNNENSGWYFSNPALIQQGTSDFQKKWGNRPLTDNWRRASSVTFAGNNTQDDEGNSNSNGNNGLPSEESLLQKIPNQQQQKDLAVKLEQRAYILLAKAYFKQLEDYKMANSTLDTLDMKYPDHAQKEEELYLRYEIAIKQNDLDNAQKYSEELTTKYPQSQYANTLRPKHTDNKSTVNVSGKPVNIFYDETYNLVMQHQYTEALVRIGLAKKQYDNPVYKKRFELIEAMCYAGNGEFNAADSMINKFMRAYPTDTLVAYATTVKQYISEVRNGGMPSWYKDWPPKEEVIVGLDRKPVKPKHTSPKEVKPVLPDVPATYAYHADSQHYCIILLPGLDSKTAGLKKSIKKFDSSNYGAANLNTLLDMYNTTQMVLVVQKFPNADSAKTYMNGILASDVFKGYNPGDLKTFIISASNYRKMFADKNTQSYTTFYSLNYKL